MTTYSTEIELEQQGHWGELLVTYVTNENVLRVELLRLHSVLHWLLVCHTKGLHIKTSQQHKRTKFINECIRLTPVTRTHTTCNVQRAMYNVTKPVVTVMRSYLVSPRKAQLLLS